MSTEKLVDRKGFYAFVKLKPVWVLMLACLAYIIYMQGWPSPAFDAMVVKATAVFAGALVGLLVDAVHFRLWPPTNADPDYENRRRRTFVIAVGMLAMALSV